MSDAYTDCFERPDRREQPERDSIPPELIFKLHGSCYFCKKRVADSTLRFVRGDDPYKGICSACVEECARLLASGKKNPKEGTE